MSEATKRKFHTPEFKAKVQALNNLFAVSGGIQFNIEQGANSSSTLTSFAEAKTK